MTNNMNSVMIYKLGDTFILLLISIIAVVQEITCANVSLSIKDLCPYTDFCTTEAQRKLNAGGLPLSSCCFPCFCSDFCWARGDCCVDVTHAPPEDIADLTSAVECAATSYTYEHGHWEPVLKKTETFGYYIWMISRCTGWAADHPYADMCFQTSNSSLADLVAVWSPSTRDVYRNQYCALCYNVTDYESISIDIGDITGYLAEDENVTWDVIEYIVTHSSTANTFTINPGNEINRIIPHCNLDPAISDCRGNYDLGPYGEVIRQQCYDGQFHPFSGHHFGPKSEKYDMIYNNVFCYLCDGGYRPGNETHGLFLNMNKICVLGNPVPIWFEEEMIGNTLDQLLPHYIQLETSKQNTRSSCEATAIMDPYMHICRPLVCPDFSLAFNGTCYYTHIDEKPRTVSYLLKADKNIFPSPDLTRTIILQKLDFTFSGYRYITGSYVCSVEVAMNDIPDSPTTDYYVSIGFQAFGTESFPYRYPRQANLFIATEQEFGYKLQARLLKGVDARTSPYTTSWLDPKRRQCEGSFSVIKVWCPTIELSESDVAYCETHGVLPKDFEFNNPSELARNRSVARQICVQDYLRFWDNASIANGFYVGRFVCTVLIYSSIAYFLFQ